MNTSQINRIIRKLGGLEVLLYKTDLNIVSLVTLNINLDLDLLQKSVDRAKNIHKMSGATIISIDNVLHFAYTSVPVKINEITLQKHELDNFINNELNYIFISGNPLFRLHYLSIGNDRFLLFNFHHVISDGRSVTKYISDLFNIYNNSYHEDKDTACFPDCIESNFLKELLPIETKTIGTPTSNKSLIYKKRKSITIMDCIDSNNRISTTLRQFNTKSISSVLASIAMKRFYDVTKKRNLTCYLSVDLRNLFKSDICYLSFLSIGFAHLMPNVNETPLCEIVHNLQNATHKCVANSNFLKDALTNVFCQSDAIAVSYIKGSVVKELEKNNLIHNVSVYGNCMYFPGDTNKIFIVFSKFKNNIDFSLNYDTRSFSNNDAELFFKYMVIDIRKYFVE